MDTSKLNAPTPEERLETLSKLMDEAKKGNIQRAKSEGYVNNHIHTIYSFSPYSPTAAVYYAWLNGLDTAGIMDHDSVCGAREFIEAGRIAGMPVTVGAECRVKTDGTPLYGRRINNPDQISVAYLAMHGIPHQNIEKADEFFAPLRAKRNERNIKMCAKINQITAGNNIDIDFEADVLPISKYAEGGGVTERHVLFALAKKITSAYPVPADAVEFLEKKLGLPIDDKTRQRLLEANPAYYEYDILGLLKSHMVEHFYIDADEECPHITEFIDKCKEIGAISAYAYLGDVGDSVTGDKKTQKFEDSYLDELMETLKSLEFNAVTYMPTRNTKQQLERVMALCDKYGFFQISGEDINSPRQSFICKALNDPSYQHLKTATYALIGHESAATINFNDAMFGEKADMKYDSLKMKIDAYAKIGKTLKI